MAPPELVWQWVAEPRGWPAWNPKIEEVVPMTPDAPAEGWRFRIAYRLRKNKKQLAEAELLEFVRGERLVCRTMGGDLNPGGWIRETYELHPDEDTTVLTHSIDLTYSRMPFFSRLAVIVLGNVFNSNGALGHVRNLKALMEDGVPPPSIK